MRRYAQGSLAANLALMASCTIWGAAFLLGKLALREITVSQLVLMRFAFGSTALLPVLLVRRAWIRRSDVPRFVLTGFLAVPLTFLLQFQGLALTTVARASLILGAIPPFLALAGVVFLKERPGTPDWIAIALSMLGILAIIGLPGGGGSLPGDGLVLLSTMVSVVWVILNKRLSEHYGALVATSYVLLFGTFALAPVTLLWGRAQGFTNPGQVWAEVLMLGLLCTTLAFVLWNWGLERVPASRAGVYLNLEPLVGALLGVKVLKEPVQPGLVLGGLLIISAALIIARSPSHGGEGHLDQGSCRRGMPHNASAARRRNCNSQARRDSK
jgi:drug/metabolite transporter (DMT)-like permease